MKKGKVIREEEPEPTLPDRVRISSPFEILAGHGHIGDILEAQITGTMNQGVHVQIRNRRRRC